jgi:hypothetical protein
MTKEPFRIFIIGDAGYDIYTRTEKGYLSKDRRTPLPEAAIDIDVPSGAAFSGVVFQHIFDGTQYEIRTLTHPRIRKARNEGAFLFHKRHLIHLRTHHSNVQKRRSVLRASQTEPIDNITTTVSRDNFTPYDNLVDLFAADNVSQLAARPRMDLLMIHDGSHEWREYPKRIPKKNGHRTVSACGLAAAALARYHLDSNRGNSESGRDRVIPRIVVNMSHDLPRADRDRKGALCFPKNMALWNVLASEPQAVCVVCSADVLRSAGLSISRRLSWEQTAEDLLAEIGSCDQLALLCQFRHVVIRFGMVAAIHIMTTERCRTADLVFAPAAREMIYRDPLEDGQLFGNNVLLSAALVDSFRAHSPRGRFGDLRQVFVRSLKTGLQSIVKVYENGYQTPKIPTASGGDRSQSTTALGEEFIRLLIKPAKEVILEGYTPPSPYNDNERVLGHFSLPTDVVASCMQRQRPDTRWNILGKSLSLASASHLDPAVLRINIGQGIVSFGQNLVLNRDFHEEVPCPPDALAPTAQEETQLFDAQIRSVLTRPPCAGHEIPDNVTVAEGQYAKVATQPRELRGTAEVSASTRLLQAIYAPIRKFGRLTVIERDEIESLNSIRNLMKGYLENLKNGDPFTRPISVAVFGPPGSGKSFTVKQIAEDVNASIKKSRRALEIIEYNMAQLQAADQLADAFVRVASINNEGKTPLVFFDEFDCPFNGKPFGWLKYFLAPMNDGTYYGARQTVSIGPGIFVFAGGVCDSFRQFVQTRDKRSERRFRQQKGPDFVSRLGGHIDILPANSRPGETKHIIRRAITLRGLIEGRGLTIARSVGEHRVDLANIDDDIVYAMLTVNRYRHGMRSMEAILRMCQPMDGRIEKASLPSRAQLDMHVDADEFVTQMLRGRSRLQSGEFLQELPKTNIRGDSNEVWSPSQEAETTRSSRTKSKSHLRPSKTNRLLSKEASKRSKRKRSVSAH